jgi:hypothetical protein
MSGMENFENAANMFVYISYDVHEIVDGNLTLLPQMCGKCGNGLKMDFPTFSADPVHLETKIQKYLFNRRWTKKAHHFNVIFPPSRHNTKLICFFFLVKNI